MLNNFFTSGWNIEDNANDVKNKYQMLNIGLVISGIGLMFGMVSNFIVEASFLIYIDIFMLFINLIMFFLLRVDRKYFKYVSNILTGQFSLLFILLIYVSDPSQMKHVWFFTYPIIILYLQEPKKAFIWLVFLFIMILIAPLQTFIDVSYSIHQIIYILFVLMVVSAIVYFYKIKIDEAKVLIVKQQNELQNFNTELELKVENKTAELQELNESLEIKVREKIKELITKDRLITAQSKQAVMGEMISMIAHQWRQPLSTITLQISNLHIKKMLGETVSSEQTDKVLSDISDTIVYLSDTIDDFQTYFRPNKEQENIEIYELLQRAVNFALPRTKSINIEIINDTQKGLYVTTYVNEMIQVVLNLINNSIDAAIENKKKETKIILEAIDKEDSIVIYLKDNAGGISEKNLSHIFEPYFSTKGKNGTGLGLYMSQMIVEKQFHGDIKVESSKNETTFIVEISKLA